MAGHMHFVASNVTGGIVPNSGHWIMEENPQATIKLVTDFLPRELKTIRRKKATIQEIR